MSSTREALGFWGKREEAISEIRKTFFPLTVCAGSALTPACYEVYADLVDRLEELVIEGSEEMRARYGGREEGM